MSYSTLYLLNKKSTREVKDFRNGWGSCPLCWDYLAEVYFADLNFTDYNRTDYIGFDRKWKMVWALADTDRLKSCEMLALKMTFDYAYVPITHLAEAGEECREFHKLSSALPSFVNHVNHWEDIGLTLLELSQRKFSLHTRGVVLNGTSVNNIWWSPTKERLENAWPIYEEAA
ncbi:hypothetical protein EVC24_149 [Rhizobium phage RHph_I4]|nr:hypothetical protein EVC24_149 [Rhizobium phage RHph_I4]